VQPRSVFYNRTMDTVKDLVILSVTHHRQNPSESTYKFRVSLFGSSWSWSSSSVHERFCFGQCLLVKKATCPCARCDSAVNLDRKGADVFATKTFPYSDITTVLPP
jgi:hypothetical protein